MVGTVAELDQSRRRSVEVRVKLSQGLSDEFSAIAEARGLLPATLAAAALGIVPKVLVRDGCIEVAHGFIWFVLGGTKTNGSAFDGDVGCGGSYVHRDWRSGSVKQENNVVHRINSGRVAFIV